MDADARIARIVTRLTLEEKVGQLVLGTIIGTEMDDASAAMLRECHLSGAVLFGRNFAGIAQARTLTAAIHDLCALDGLPALVGADQEGGRVQRLMPEATPFPSAMALGATDDPALITRIGAMVGREMRALHLNVDFAPVCDVNNNPANPVIGTRSFGETPERVGALAVAMAAGLRTAGVAATAKHFPGHGDTHVDSHLDLPTVVHDLTRLRAVELAPFAAAIAAAIPLVMTSHIVFPALEPDGLPATLSARILTGLLRDEMGFAGVIVSDAMRMRAITDHYGIAEACVQAVIAGNDLVEPMTEERAVVAALVAAARSGRLTAARLDDAAGRVLRLRQSLSAGPKADLDAIGTEEHRALVRAAAEASVTLLDARPAALPLPPGAKIGVVEFTLARANIAEERTMAHPPLLGAFLAHFPQARGVTLDATELAEREIAAARALAAGVDTLVIGTRDANLFPAQAAARDALLSGGKRAVVITLRAPYDCAEMSGAAAMLATYGDLPASLDAAAAICAGVLLPRGRLPVSVGARYSVGHRASLA